MNRLSTLLIAALLAFTTLACEQDVDETPLPQLDINKAYTATTISTGSIFMGISGRWLSWATDSARIKPLLARITEEGKNPGFLPQNTSLPAAGGRLSFSTADSLAYLLENGEEKAYRFGVPAGYSLLMLRSTDTLQTFQNQQPAPLDRITYLKPAYYNQIPLTDQAFEFEVRTLPERYFTIATPELRAPGIHYYLKTRDDVEFSASINNYLNDKDAILQSLSEGDTLVLQAYRTDYR